MPDADVVVFRKINQRAPDFHKHILIGKVKGRIVNPGDRVMMYEIEETIPAGPVRVIESTKLEFR